MESSVMLCNNIKRDMITEFIIYSVVHFRLYSSALLLIKTAVTQLPYFL